MITGVHSRHNVHISTRLQTSDQITIAFCLDCLRSNRKIWLRGRSTQNGSDTRAGSNYTNNSFIIRYGDSNTVDAHIYKFVSWLWLVCEQVFEGIRQMFFRASDIARQTGVSNVIVRNPGIWKIILRMSLSRFRQLLHILCSVIATVLRNYFPYTMPSAWAALKSKTKSKIIRRRIWIIRCTYI